ncbi:MAG: hypothetical protein R2844_18185 [Caldilineales bacterium]
MSKRLKFAGPAQAGRALSDAQYKIIVSGSGAVAVSGGIAAGAGGVAAKTIKGSASWWRGRKPTEEDSV